MEVVDIAGLVAGSSTGEGLGNRFLAGIREVDAVLLVLRSFVDDEVPGESDPIDALETLELELVLADAASLENQAEKRRKQARLKSDKNLGAEADAMDAAMAHLQAGVPLYRAGLGAEQRGLLAGSFLLTDKPVLAVVNLGEDQVERADAIVNPVAESLGGAGQVLGRLRAARGGGGAAPRRSTRRAPRRPRPRRGGPAARGAGGLRAARSPHLSHDG